MCGVSWQNEPSSCILGTSRLSLLCWDVLTGTWRREGRHGGWDGVCRVCLPRVYGTRHFFGLCRRWVELLSYKDQDDRVNITTKLLTLSLDQILYSPIVTGFVPPCCLCNRTLRSFNGWMTLETDCLRIWKSRSSLCFYCVPTRSDFEGKMTDLWLRALSGTGRVPVCRW